MPGLWERLVKSFVTARVITITENFAIEFLFFVLDFIILWNIRS